MNPPEGLISVVIPVFRDGARALTAVHAMLMQVLPTGFDSEVLVVDDGSGDDTVKILTQYEDQRVQVLQLGCNQGRSAARNAGAQQARGEMIVFMDCDCVPAHDDFIAAHLSALQSGFVASTGHVIGTDNGFWGRYQHAASRRRERQFTQGAPYAGSSQNLAVRRSTFEKIGGFDKQYRHYGFEDRDLLLRLAGTGDVAWAANAVVRHLDTLTLPEVSRKMMNAGGQSARYFAKSHPAAYAKLGYAAIDARLHPWLRPIGITMGRLALPVASFLDSLLERLPFPMARVLVKTTAAISFLYGTTRDRQPTDRF
jgi:glycosyltransferase involved in cell wall biosynthesis